MHAEVVMRRKVVTIYSVAFVEEAMKSTAAGGIILGH
jgi:hypothetical protein